jgi:hypothetical protein
MLLMFAVEMLEISHYRCYRIVNTQSRSVEELIRQHTETVRKLL